MTLVWASGYNGITDPDAQTYLAAVEAADGQALEGDVALAINDFVVGCKLDGIWDAIKASCILAGARTLSGALVPLKGPAPTNNNFVAGDYGRENGIHVNAASKYLDTNRNNNADPQNSNHNACFVTNSLGGTQLVMGSTGGEATGANTTLLIYGGAGVVRNRCFTAAFIGVPPPNTFYGVNRNTSASFSYRLNRSNFNINRSSQTPHNNNVKISDWSSAGCRLSFYSIGESLDLEKLDNRTTRLMNGISYAVSPDADAQTYIQAVETADNQKLEFYVAAAINAFVVGCKADGIWDAIKASCILAGARTLAGALVPLKGTAPTNFDFVSGDYNRETGLVGDGSTKYLNSNRNNNADPQNNNHNAVYMTVTGAGSVMGVLGTFDTGANNIGGVNTRNRNVSSEITPTFQPGFVGTSRSGNGSYVFRNDGANTTFSRTSQTPQNSNIAIYRADTFYSSARLSFYSIGEALNLALLNNRVSILMTDIGAAIP